MDPFSPLFIIQLLTWPKKLQSLKQPQQTPPKQQHHYDIYKSYLLHIP